MSLTNTYENDNEAFKAFTIHFVQKQIDYDYSINVMNVMNVMNESLIVSVL